MCGVTMLMCVEKIYLSFSLEDEMVTRSVLYVFIFTLSMYFFFINQKKVKKKSPVSEWSAPEEL